MRLIYRIVGITITPLLRIWLARRAKRGKEDVARLGERFGHASAPRPAGKLVWLHAASVGEAQSVLTLVRALLREHVALHVLITTGTVTSAALVAQQNLPRAIHQFVPVDTYPAVKRFLQHWQPDLALWVESELWPQLLWQTHAKNVSLLLINARMSARSFASWKKWPRTIVSLLGCFDTIYAGSSDDAARIAALGAKHVQDIGNLKYDADALPVDAAQLQTLRAQTQNRQIWVAASTHANEEQMIAETDQMLRSKFPDLLTIIVPRHATRGDAVASELREKNIALAQRSKNEPILPTTHIYLADTMGELGNFYEFSGIVFLGGSLIAHGGHNPLEPARQHCALITGMHTHNFASIMDQFHHAEAILTVKDAQALADAGETLLSDELLRSRMAERAFAIIEQSKGAGSIILLHCKELLASLPA